VLAEGAKAEKAYAENGTLPDPESTDNPEFKIVLGLIRDGLKKNPTKWTKYAEALQGMASTCLHHLQAFPPLFLPMEVIFETSYACLILLPDPDVVLMTCARAAGSSLMPDG
jgi:hypothetical protein